MAIENGPLAPINLFEVYKTNDNSVGCFELHFTIVPRKHLLGVVISQIRKYLSTYFVRAQSLCLINRCFLGEGAKAAAGRRDLAKGLEIARKRDLQAHYQAHIWGQGLAKTGLIFVT